MFSLIYFIPNIKALKPETFAEYGLHHLNKGNTTNGPSTSGLENKPGFFIQNANTETKIGYRPETQTWKKIKVGEDKYIWIGYDNDEKIKPKLNQLEKKNVEITNYFEVKLNDGNVYKIPRAQYIPQSFEFSSDGEIVRGLSEKYKDIIDISEKYYLKFATGFRQANEDGELELVVDDFEIVKDVAGLLSTFYKISYLECILYKLFDSVNMITTLKTFLGYDAVEEIEKEEKELVEAEKKTVSTE